MCRILIERSGGNIQRIVADREMQVVIVDYDNEEYSDGDDPAYIANVDEILIGNERFSKHYASQIDEESQLIAETLKSLNV